MERWQGRVAVVTGASEGIGEAIVRKLAASGMRVVALARRQALLELVSLGLVATSMTKHIPAVLPNLVAKDIADAVEYVFSTPPNVNVAHFSESRTVFLVAPNRSEREMERWRDRVAVVTGASEGIGAAVVRRLTAAGMRVVALARRQALLEELERSVNVEGAQGSVKGYICDVTSQSDVTAAFKSIDRDLGPISILVNNAGLLKPVNLTDIDLNYVKAMYDTNIMGVMNCVKAGLESMKIHNVSDGHIINISSVAAHKVPEITAFGVYSSTKHALAVISKSIRDQLRKENSSIRVSCVSPGLVKTAMTEGFLRGNADGRHYLLPEDIADAVEYVIASPRNVNVSDMIVEPV